MENVTSLSQAVTFQRNIIRQKAGLEIVRFTMISSGTNFTEEGDMSSVKRDDFIVELIAFVTNLHYCHICKCVQGQISGRNGKRRTICTKYNLPIQRVRWNCVDRFGGFNNTEIRKIKRQYKTGECKLVLNGVAV